jgi:hypothetical protein
MREGWDCQLRWVNKNHVIHGRKAFTTLDGKSVTEVLENLGVLNQHNTIAEMCVLFFPDMIFRKF